MGLTQSLNQISGTNATVGSALTGITSIVNQYIVGPLAAFGISGFVFNAVGEAAANLSADITDHYTEDNTAIQDHIAIHPKRITLKGYVGELVYNSAGNAPSTLNTLAQKLTSLSSFLPTLSASATQAQNALASPLTGPMGILENPASILGATSSIYGLVQNVLGAFGPTKNQQNAYTYFKALMQSGTLMGIQTPWEFMTNMAIEHIMVMQDEKSMWISDFSISLKEIRIASTSTTAFSSGSNASATPAGVTPPAAVCSGVSNVQAANSTNLGPCPGAATSVTPESVSATTNFGPPLN